MPMKIIKEKSEKTYIIQKSKFIGLIYRVNNKEEINTILFECKKKHPLATHICYAYILPNTKKYSDDNVRKIINAVLDKVSNEN